ncbi:uncharacterized protein L969DRAFT_114240 [Mixia osmundae IAM 14324]|uniref:Uncharacterized protein n=1 Tax=Mixia osmundae (strain CBS 9802 / IAM 14324 / JCM 22182 / KY 12970) TaxID=764103 RepID=G7E3Q4_MIXOS|nr:uncharacterized protein L969DRAFT_114240 [Mixia osmundae IAM 14324]KEI41876.1 hypothetical protein L969DRAFT_114240 [Mixia osmundae IAM 14324]GAA97464.1 hypothetical protein E5Q_04143 [Mixia osmundae IAM 14324]
MSADTHRRHLQRPTCRLKQPADSVALSPLKASSFVSLSSSIVSPTLSLQDLYTGHARAVRHYRANVGRVRQLRVCQYEPMPAGCATASLELRQACCPARSERADRSFLNCCIHRITTSQPRERASICARRCTIQAAPSQAAGVLPRPFDRHFSFRLFLQSEAP